MALIRALETAKPAREALFADPWARRFLPRWKRALVGAARVPSVRRRIEARFDGRAPGARTSGAARTRLIDDWTRTALAEGLGQVVILGAGFDCRALRMPELGDIPTFEVDRAPMIARKRRVLGRERGELVRVEVDFLDDPLEQRLRAVGFRATTGTLFIWEGVTNYLDASSIATTFDFIARCAPAGSKVIFTYVHAGALDGSFAAPGLAQLLLTLRAYGEPWTFGFVPSELPAYLRERGLTLLCDLGAAEYRARYSSAAAKRLIGYEFYRAAIAASGKPGE